MTMTASLERGMAHDRRRYLRQQTNIGAGLSANIRPSTAVAVTDLSPGGCGVRTDWELEPGTRVWIRFPGMESAPARVAWCEGRQAGLCFDNPFHPAVVARLISS
jgi:hypothetical protein